MRKFFSFMFLVGIIINPIQIYAQTQPASANPFSITLLDEAGKYRQKILESYDRKSVSKGDALRRQMTVYTAFKHGDYYSYSANAKSIIVDNPADFQAWVFIALGRNNLGDKDYKLEALYAAINAYQVAPDELSQAVALKLAADADSSYRDAFKAVETKLGTKPIKDKLDAFTSSYPQVFAIYNLEVPDTSDVGTVHLSLTKPLLKLKDARYEDYVSIAPQVKDLKVIGKGERLTISGLTFGGNYKITLKKGLKGEQGYQLAADETVDVYVKHRKPSIAFRERGYILPSKGPQLLPLKSINVPSAYIRVFRIPQENLNKTLKEGDFLNQIYGYNVSRLQDEDAELVAEGAFDTKGNMDEAIVKGIPLEKVLGDKLQSGLYVVQAQVSKKDSYEDQQNATQWLVVSDIGLTTFVGPDGLHVGARSLESAKELSGVEVTLVARNGRTLGSLKTDKTGYVHFDEKLLSGQESNRPSFIYATNEGKDFSFLNFRREGYDFSDRGVQGRDPTGKAEAYVFTERGIYRPGEQVTVTALVRDQHGKALPNAPLTFRVFRPDGVETLTKVTQDSGAGAHTYTLDTQANSFTGQWVVSAYLDPKGPEIGRVEFQLDDFVPPRIEVVAKIKQPVLYPQDAAETQVNARYFYGPMASNLKVEGLVELVEDSKPFEKWKDYHFGLEEESWTPLKFNSDPTTTNDKGEATLRTLIGAKPDTTKMLAANSVVTVFEANGRGRMVNTKTSFWHKPYAIGIRPENTSSSLPENTDVKFSVIAIDESGELKEASSLNYTLYEETHSFSWYRSGMSWNYETVIDDKPIKNGKLDIKGGEPFVLKVPVKFGHYRIEVLDEKTGVATSYRFHAGWGGVSDIPDRPDMIEMTIDKPSYRAGDTVSLSLVSPFDGELSVMAIDGQHCRQVYDGKAKQKGTKVEIKLDEKLLNKSGLYLMATVFRPMDIKSEKTPNRAIGLIWVDGKNGMPKLEMSVHAPDLARPERDYEVKVCFKNKIKNPHAMVMVVDEAILNITDFKTPNPFDYIFEQIKLAYVYRDSYGQLINPFGARPGDFKVGGDGFARKDFLIPLQVNTFKILSLNSGVISEFKETKDEGCALEAIVPFSIPEFSGKARVMGVAWNDDSTGSAETSSTIREPVEVNLALPRFLAPGDKTSIVMDVHNLTGAVVDIKLSLEVEGEIAVLGEATNSLPLKKDELVHLPIELQAKTAGVGKLIVHIKADDVDLKKHWEIAVRSTAFPILKRTGGVLQPGKSVIFDETMVSDIVPSNRKLQVSVGTYSDFGAPSLRKELRAYAYGCLEQLTSRLGAEIYAPKGSRDEAQTLDIIGQMQALQQYDGPFGLWSAQGSSERWLSLYAVDLLNKAHNDKIELGTAATTRGMNWIREIVQRNGDNSDVGMMPYALYIMAKQGQGALGALKYFADNYKDQIRNRDECAFIGAAFALYGDADSAKVWFNKAIAVRFESLKGREFFQSWIADTAILVALMTESLETHPQLMDLSAQLVDLLTKINYLSTFEKGWLLRAAHALEGLGKSFKFTLAGKSHEGTKPVDLSLVPEQQLSKPKLENTGSTPFTYMVNVSGEPADPSKLPNNGFTVTRSLYTMSGKPVDPATIKSGDLLVAVIKGECTADDTHRVMIVDMLPAGFELETVKFNQSYMQENFSWIDELTSLSRVEKRDDRYMAAFDLEGKGEFTLTYFVRALNPGSYKYPAVVAESMYRPQYSARSSEGVLTIKP